MTTPLTHDEALAAHRATPVRWLGWRTNIVVSVGLAVFFGATTWWNTGDPWYAAGVLGITAAAALVVRGILHANIAPKLAQATDSRSLLDAVVVDDPPVRAGTAQVRLADGRLLRWPVGPSAGMPPTGTPVVVLAAHRGDLTRLLYRRDDGSVGVVDPGGVVTHLG